MWASGPPHSTSPGCALVSICLTWCTVSGYVLLRAATQAHAWLWKTHFVLLKPSRTIINRMKTKPPQQLFSGCPSQAYRCQLPWDFTFTWREACLIMQHWSRSSKKMFLEGTKEGQLAPVLIVLLSLTANNILLEICLVLEHHCDNKPWGRHHWKTITDNNSPCPLPLQRCAECSLPWSSFGKRKSQWVSWTAGVHEVRLRSSQKSCPGCSVLVLRSLSRGLLEVFTLQLSPIF